jgi:hypothetical protein
LTFVFSFHENRRTIGLINSHYTTLAIQNRDKVGLIYGEMFHETLDDPSIGQP